MITRRDILKMLGFGGAAAAVLPAAAKASEAGAGFKPIPLPVGARLLTHEEAVEAAGHMEPLTLEPLPVFDPYTERTAGSLARVEYVSQGSGPVLYDDVALFTPDYERPKLLGVVESIEPDGTAWVRIGGRTLDGCCSVGLPRDWATDALEDYLEQHQSPVGRGVRFRELVEAELSRRRA